MICTNCGHGFSINEIKNGNCPYCKNNITVTDTMKENAKNGDMNAQRELAFCYEIGCGIRQNLCEASQWYRLLTNNILKSSIIDIFSEDTLEPEDSDFENEDEVTLYDLLLKEAAEENIESIVKLGMCYEIGLNVEQDLQLAVKCYKQGAEQGNEDALFRLGNCYEN